MHIPEILHERGGFHPTENCEWAFLFSLFICFSLIQVVVMGNCREEILRTVKQQNMHQINTHTNIPNYQNRTNFKFQPNITANTCVVKICLYQLDYLKERMLHFWHTSLIKPPLCAGLNAFQRLVKVGDCPYTSPHFCGSSRVGWDRELTGQLRIDPGSKQKQPAGIEVNWQLCAPP